LHRAAQEENDLKLQFEEALEKASQLQSELRQVGSDLLKERNNVTRLENQLKWGDVKSTEGAVEQPPEQSVKEQDSLKGKSKTTNKGHGKGRLSMVRDISPGKECQRGKAIKSSKFRWTCK
jgi:hypothetical protein